MSELLEQAVPLIDLVRRTATNPAVGSLAVELLAEIKRTLAKSEVCEWYRDRGNLVHCKCSKCDVMPSNLLHATMATVEEHRSRTWFAPGCGRPIKIREVSGGTT